MEMGDGGLASRLLLLLPILLSHSFLGAISPCDPASFLLLRAVTFACLSVCHFSHRGGEGRQPSVQANPIIPQSLPSVVARILSYPSCSFFPIVPSLGPLGRLRDHCPTFTSADLVCFLVSLAAILPTPSHLNATRPSITSDSSVLQLSPPTFRKCVRAIPTDQTVVPEYSVHLADRADRTRHDVNVSDSWNRCIGLETSAD